MLRRDSSFSMSRELTSSLFIHPLSLISAVLGSIEDFFLVSKFQVKVDKWDDGVRIPVRPTELNSRDY
jgi:hypothetical protein